MEKSLPIVDADYKEIRVKYDERHGGPYDRGDADRYYGRPVYPHYYKGSTYNGDPITDLTSQEITAYMAGYQGSTVTKY